ncbi:DNA binding domain protein, excisionase family [Kribbella flavida DSM 17836]|uniref:DNA binding domain protein, excisionase family n=1 Tax=Kribbella flavida (strain DSM 17836 / JCM 10339 / NBRC 14399) TaxID=479435 RepID=D2Q0C9_KRIFD|nr:helix-turn-helix domain-containing protein [Kribbella flavida]ADB31921.1 DNA binding domain protein, excisionase family [Kribbella flavida DSM 17836]
MRQELYSVEQVAEQLGLHVRTIRNYVRDGKLKATRIGKQYRITREDLEAFTGTSMAVPAGGGLARHAEVSSIVQIDGLDRAGADRLTTYVTASINQGDLGRLRVELAYDETREVLKIIVLGDLGVTADLLRLIDMVATSAQP